MNRKVNWMLTKMFQHPWIKYFWTRRYRSLSFDWTSWTPLEGTLAEKRIAMVTTGGVHPKTDKPFDMSDTDGDPSFRIFPSHSQANELTITHDYYDHSDGDRDINVIIPLQALRTCVRQGLIGSLSTDFFSFMGHIQGRHIETLLQYSCPDLIQRLKQDRVEVVLLAPA